MRDELNRAPSSDHKNGKCGMGKCIKLKLKSWIQIHFDLFRPPSSILYDAGHGHGHGGITLLF